MSGERESGAPIIEISAEPTARDIAFIEDNLSAFNRRFYPLPDNRLPLCVFLREADGTIVGGVTGHTRWDWLYLDCFWLPEHARAAGVGGKILALAEAEAAKRGCTRSCLFTYGFQAQGFYERHGYAVFGAQEDYPPGDRKIWMRKDLDGPIS